ncbi:MAG: hypothetical protein R2880_14655 [Deinococcales bacterium]
MASQELVGMKVVATQKIDEVKSTLMIPAALLWQLDEVFKLRQEIERP